MKSKGLMILALVAALAVAPAFAGRIDFKTNDDFLFLTPIDMTADGSKLLMTGVFGGPVFTWSEDEGLVQIGNGGCSGGIPSMSSDGSTIVGNEPDANGVCQAARYNGTPFDWTPMGSEPGSVPCGFSGISSAYDTNNDTAVGLFWRPQQCRAIGGSWDVSAGIAGPVLTSTVPDRPTRGNGITEDGQIVVGWQDAQTGARQGARWVNGVQELILSDNGLVNGEAQAVSRDGTTIVGSSYEFQGNGLGWIWHEGQGMQSFGVGAYGLNVQTHPVSVSDDGKTVVGNTLDFTNFVRKGWIWTEKRGYEFLEDFLKGQRAAGWDIQSAAVVSADGTRIGGWGFNPNGQAQGFVIDLGATGQN